MPLGPDQLALAMSILAVAYFIKGVTSFGAALVCVPLLGIFLADARDFVPMLAVLNAVTNGVLLKRFWRDVDRGAVLWLLAGAVVGIPFGARLLATLPAESLRMLIGGAVVLSVPMIFWIRRLKHGRPVARRWALLSGVVSGICGGAVAIDGPPVVAHAAIAQPTKEKRFATLIAYFFVGALIRIVVYHQQGLLDADGWRLALWTLPAVGMGLTLGTRVYLRLDEKAFDRLMAMVLLASGFALVIRSLLTT